MTEQPLSPNEAGRFALQGKGRLLLCMPNYFAD